MSMKQLKEIRNKYKKYIQQIDKYLDKI
jgi:hypothetical protein